MWTILSLPSPSSYLSLSSLHLATIPAVWFSKTVAVLIDNYILLQFTAKMKLILILVSFDIMTQWLLKNILVIKNSCMNKKSDNKPWSTLLKRFWAKVYHKCGLNQVKPKGKPVKCFSSDLDHITLQLMQNCQF